MYKPASISVHCIYIYVLYIVEVLPNDIQACIVTIHDINYYSNTCDKINMSLQLYIFTLLVQAERLRRRKSTTYRSVS